MINRDEYLDAMTLETRDYDDEAYAQDFAEFYRGLIPTWGAIRTTAKRPRAGQQKVNRIVTKLYLIL